MAEGAQTGANGVMTVIALAANAAEDPTLVSQLTELDNDAYTVAECDLWTKAVPRTNIDETRQAIAEGQVTARYVNHQLVGAVRSHRLDERPRHLPTGRHRPAGCGWPHHRRGRR